MMRSPIRVLLIEDNPGDAELTRELLAESKVFVDIIVQPDGEEGVAYLEQCAKRPSDGLPDLILLDLNLPGMSGRDVLSHVKGEPILRKIPVVVLTSSASESDILKSYDLGANCYVTKPVGLRAFETIVRSIEGFWFSVVRLP